MRLRRWGSGIGRSMVTPVGGSVPSLAAGFRRCAFWRPGRSVRSRRQRSHIGVFAASRRTGMTFSRCTASPLLLPFARSVPQLLPDPARIHVGPMLLDNEPAGPCDFHPTKVALEEVHHDLLRRGLIDAVKKHHFSRLDDALHACGLFAGCVRENTLERVLLQTAFPRQCQSFHQVIPHRAPVCIAGLLQKDLGILQVLQAQACGCLQGRGIDAFDQAFFYSRNHGFYGQAQPCSLPCGSKAIVGCLRGQCAGL